jgi:Flp pilus assembly protein TadG
MLLRRTRRRGTVVVESAVIYPVLFVLLLGIVLMGMTIFRYQQCAHAAREGARWASVHGSAYSTEQNQPATTQQNVIDNAVSPQFAGMTVDGVELACTVSWPNGQDPTRAVTITDPVTLLPEVVARSNTVSVTVTYSWDTGFFGVLTVSSTSVNQMSY